MLHILMSTYNGERYLSAQIESILTQDYTDWRLFVRDDGSIDGTCRILTHYAQQDKRITVVRDGENLGACRSFGRLLEQYGEAEYFAFADQDDVWLPEKLTVCMNEMHRQESETGTTTPIVVHTDLRVVDEDLQELAPSFWKYSNIKPELLNTRIRYLAICNTVTGCACLFNRAARDCSVPVSKDAYMHDAWVALMTLYHKGRIAALTQATVLYRQHRGNVLGAVQYKTFGRGIARRRFEAEVCYRRARGYVYKNKVQFMWWKVIYFIHRSFWGIGK